MIKVEQIAFENSLKNYSYLVSWINDKTEKLACIDPFDGELILEYLQKRQLGLDMVLNTHQHYDHIRGNDLLCKHFNCPALSQATSECSPLQSFASPGHTQEHVCYWIEQGNEFHYFLGDTLFEGGVGNCKNGGDPKTLYHTIEKLINRIHPDAKIWVGHDYKQANDKFCQWVLGEQLEGEKKSEYLTWQNQLKNNIFLRIFQPQFRIQLKSKRLDLFSDCHSCQDFFLKLRSLRDQW